MGGSVIILSKSIGCYTNVTTKPRNLKEVLMKYGSKVCVLFSVVMFSLLLFLPRVNAENKGFFERLFGGGAHQKQQLKRRQKHLQWVLR